LGSRVSKTSKMSTQECIDVVTHYDDEMHSILHTRSSPLLALHFMDDVQTFLQSKKLGYWSSNMYERIFAVSMTSRLVELQLIPTTLAPTTRFFKQKVLRPLNHKNLLKYQLYTSYNYESLVADFRICPVLVFIKSP
jgi:hypothetical protein